MTPRFVPASCGCCEPERWLIFLRFLMVRSAVVRVRLPGLLVTLVLVLMLVVETPVVAVAVLCFLAAEARESRHASRCRW